MKKNPKLLYAVNVLLDEWKRSDFWKGLLAGAVLVALVLVSWRLALFVGGLAVICRLARRDG